MFHPGNGTFQGYLETYTGVAGPANEGRSGPRYEPGTAFGQGEAVGGGWIEGANDRGGSPIPAQIAQRLDARTFGSFDAFRGAFWTEVGNDPELATQFTPQNVTMMRNGNAPIAPLDGQNGQRIRFELDHVEEIQDGGDVYDMDNIVTKTPQSHIHKLMDWPELDG